jgi:hypothetical protein
LRTGQRSGGVYTDLTADAFAPTTAGRYHGVLGFTLGAPV